MARPVMIFSQSAGFKVGDGMPLHVMRVFCKGKYILKSARRLVIGFRDNIIARAKLKFGGIFLASFG
jgi:hypothetical protein